MKKYYRAVKRNQHQLYVCVDYSVCPRIGYLLCPVYLETQPDHQHLSAPCSLAPSRWGRSGSLMWLWPRPTKGYSRGSKGEKAAHLGSFFLVSSPPQSPSCCLCNSCSCKTSAPPCPRAHTGLQDHLSFSLPLDPREQQSSTTPCPHGHLYSLN